tara:strand:+ start:35 stop:484 length:450 start_codon:yes stop_codon:yes gene_type:complete
MKQILIILFFFLASCGYKPLLVNESNPNLIFNEIVLKGDKQINRKMISLLKIKEKREDDLLGKIIIDSKKSVVESSKDSRGRVNTFITIIKSTFKIVDVDGITEEKILEESFLYNNKENKYDLLQYQKEVEENLINKIVEEFIVYLSLK